MKVYPVLLIIIFGLTTNIFPQVQFATHNIECCLLGGRSVYAIDVDSDGDMDILSASRLDNKIAWYENDGNEVFSSRTITTDASGAESVYAEDVDGDGDMDVLSASRFDDKITWYENDGNESFTPHTISTSADGANSVYAVDIDSDGDMDVLSASGSGATGNKIAWYENDGNENFNSHTITTNVNRGRSVFAVDVDGDGDIDVLSASRNDHKIAWYENLTPVGIKSGSNEIPIDFSLGNNYPNPFNPNTRVAYSIPQTSFVTIKLYDVLGNEIAALVNEEKSAGSYEVEFGGSELTSGVYFYTLRAGTFIETKKMIFMK